MWRDKAYTLSARLMDAVRINRVSAEKSTIIKQRRWWAKFVIYIGNLFLKFSNSHIFMFTSDRAWQQWELHSYQLLYEIEGQSRGKRTIVIPPFVGESLREHIAANTLTPRMIEAAAQEFRRVHSLFSPVLGRCWTHGDPHPGNVLYDTLTGRTYLIDFETQHEPERMEIACRADDLLVFILELLGTCSDWNNHCELFLRTYADQIVLRQLEGRLTIPKGLERLLWKTRTHYLPLPTLQARLEQLQNILASVNLS